MSARPSRADNTSSSRGTRPPGPTSAAGHRKLNSTIQGIVINVTPLQLSAPDIDASDKLGRALTTRYCLYSLPITTFMPSSSSSYPPPLPQVSSPAAVAPARLLSAAFQEP